MAKETSGDTWKDRYDLAANRQERMFDKFQGWYDTMYAHINTSQYALWRSKVFIPIIPSKGRGMISKMTSLNPGWEIGLYGDALNDENAQDKADKAQWKLEHDWDNPHFDEPMSDKLFSPLMDAVVTGTGVAKIPWCFGEATRYERNQKDENGEWDSTKQEEIKTSRGYNDLVPHDVMATYIAPGAKNPYQAPWIILEDWVTYDQLEDENEAAGGELYNKEELTKAKEMTASVDRFSRQKQSRDLVVNDEDPLAADTTVNQLKRLECYERTGMIYTYVVGNNGDGKESFIKLAGRKNIYWHGKYPLVFFYVTKRPHSPWGQGIFEDTERMQSAFNDVFNHYMDNLNISMDGMIMKQEGEDFTYIVEPGGEFIYKDNPPQQFKFPEPNAQQFNTVMQFIEKQVEDATVSDYALGTPNSATDTTAGTASGIKSLQDAAGDKVGAMRKQFSNSLREIGRQWLSNNQQFLDRPVTLMGQVDSKPAPVTISPEDLQGEMILRVNDASMEATTNEQRVARFDARMQALIGLQQASIQQMQIAGPSAAPVLFDFTSLVQDRLQLDGQANIDKILLSEDKVQEVMQFMAQQQQAAAQANAPEQPAPQPPKAPSESLNYKDATPFIKKQIEAQAGLQPDPIHDHENDTLMTEHTNNQVTNMAQAMDGAFNDGQEEETSTGTSSRASKPLQRA